MWDDVLELAARLRADRQSFALATVVSRDRPQSGALGDRALVRPDGRVRGWVGGGCVRPTVIAEALEALEDRRPRLVRIGGAAGDAPPPGVRVYPMTCHGGGRVDVYVEPVFPMSRLLVFGLTPVARALSEMGRTAGLEVVAVHPDADPESAPAAHRIVRDVASAADAVDADTFVIVSTQGDGDEPALRAALRRPSAYVGFVASRRKGRTVLALLEAEGVSRQALERVSVPAGLDLGGTTPPEIAVSILAELVTVRSGRAPRGADPGGSRDMEPSSAVSAPATGPAFATDPVCGMKVQVDGARYHVPHQGTTVYFCCPMCQATFQKDPAAYAGAASE